MLLSSFDAPFNYSAKIEMISDPYNAILIGTTGNNLKFNFAVEDKSGNNTGENVDCIVSLINQGVKKTINKVYTAQQGREGVIVELDDYLTEGTNNYTGINSSTKELHVPNYAYGYESGDWQIVLQDTIGFTLYKDL